MNQKVAIIVLNWNNYEDTIKCLRSVQKSTYRDYEVIIVDNGSTNNSQEILEKEFPRVKLIQTGENLGYSGGNNRGIRHALENEANLVWVLNPDTVVAPDALEEMMREINKPGVGVAAPKIYYQDSPETVWFVGSLLNLKTGRADHVGYGQVDKGQFEEEQDLEWAPGTSLLVKKEVFEEIGFFDDKYFLFYEDVDFCVRARRAGFKIAFAPKAKIWHKVGSTVGEKNPDNEYYKTRNRLYLVKKFNSSLWWVGFTGLYGLRLIVSDREFAQAAGKGFFDFLKNNYGIKK